ncbi:MAG: hypothetical protein RL660_841 [Bacteroidota bacterium]|jgi:hypothetical protein
MCAYAQNVKVVVTEQAKLQANQLPYTKHLTWQNFKGVMPEDNGYSALTSTQFGYGLSIRTVDDKSTIKFTLRFYFDELGSKKKSTVSDSLLAHEQGHLDIAWCIYQQFKDSVQARQWQAKNIQAEASEVFHYYQQLTLDLQHQYDEATQHSVNREQQLLWDKKIAEMLAALAY